MKNRQQNLTETFKTLCLLWQWQIQWLTHWCTDAMSLVKKENNKLMIHAKSKIIEVML